MDGDWSQDLLAFLSGLCSLAGVVHQAFWQVSFRVMRYIIASEKAVMDLGVFEHIPVEPALVAKVEGNDGGGHHNEGGI